MESRKQTLENEISSLLATRWVGRRIFFYEETDSTNNQAKNLASEGAEHGTLVVSDKQTQGKGRRGRSWSSPAQTGIFMSLILKPACSPEHASMLTLVAALAGARAVRKVTGLSVGIKWPNDLVVNKKKVTGILTEMSADTGRIHYVVVGVGINANMTEFPEEIRETATSLCLEAGHEVDRAELIAAFLNDFEVQYQRFEETEDFSLLQGEYNEYLLNRDKEVRILDPFHPEGGYMAHALGVDRRGGLLIERENHVTESITSGEVSVRGVYGYV